MSCLRVVVVDDHELIRLGLRLLLEGEEGICVVGEAASGSQALEVVERLKPDIVAMDVRLPDQSGIEVCRAIKRRWPEVRVLMLTAYDSEDLVLAAVEAGADGYVLKQLEGASLLQALRSLRQGGGALDPTVTRTLLSRLRQQAKRQRHQAFEALTPREKQVLALIARGFDNDQIARALGLSEKTVRNHVTVILDKLGVANRAQAAVYALRHGIDDVVDLPEERRGPSEA